MVFRFILRYFLHNEHLVQRLSDSTPIRAAARVVAMVFHRTKSIVEEKELDKKLHPDKIKEFAKKFAENVKEEATQAKEEFKRRSK